MGPAAGEAEPGHGPQELAGAQVAAVLAGDDLADLHGGVGAAADDHGCAGDRLGLDALDRCALVRRAAAPLRPRDTGPRLRRSGEGAGAGAVIVTGRPEGAGM